MQFYYAPHEGNETPLTGTGNTWYSQAKEADSKFQKGNGPCGTKTHMVAARSQLVLPGKHIIQPEITNTEEILI